MTKKKFQVFTGNKTNVQQHFKEETNINTIVRKFSQGINPANAGSTPMYMDLSEVPEYHQALSQVTETNQKFAKLPAKIRKEFNNSPSQFVDFCQDDKNKPRAIELGLIPEPSILPEKTVTINDLREALKPAEKAEKPE